MTRKLTNIESFLLRLCEEDNLEIKFDVESGELEDGPQYFWDHLQRTRTESAIAAGFKDKEFESLWVLDASDDDQHLLMEICPKCTFYRAVYIDDGKWKVRDLEIDQGENW